MSGAPVVDPKAAERRLALANADAGMAAAKRKFSAASIACLKGDLTAERQVADALREIDQARDALRRATEEK